MVWNFDIVKVDNFHNINDLLSVEVAHPRWRIVQKLHVKEEEGERYVVGCSCNRPTTLGLLCNHIFKIARDSEIPRKDIM